MPKDRKGACLPAKSQLTAATPACLPPYRDFRALMVPSQQVDAARVEQL